jgi:hypothetical protein
MQSAGPGQPVTGGQSAQSDAAAQAALFERIFSFRADPLGYVLYNFPWGVKGTFLENETGPDDWQIRVMTAIRDGVLTPGEAIQIAVSSGHGVGKTTLVAWLIKWFMSTRFSPQIVVTANTKVQLETKTWRELAKWHNVGLDKIWFEHTATRYICRAAPKTWFAACIPWSKENSEAFAGAHDANVMVIFDEASAIDDVIWEVASGAMTTPGAIWLAFGNPTRSTGRFKECWGKFRNRWIQIKVDSRTAKKADRKQIDTWVKDYGEDSDFVRVRVRGEFPRTGSMQFIGEALVAESIARRYEPRDYNRAAIVVGCDVARFGDDKSIIYVRQGLQTLRVKKFRGIDTMNLASRVIETADEYHADAMFVDEIGIGAGVVDRIHQVGRECIGVNVGRPAADPRKYFNKRAELWGRARDWLDAGGAIPDDQELKDDLTGPEYGYSASEQIQIEKKEDMKARGLASPDVADSLCLTFALPVSPKYVWGEYDYDAGLERSGYSHSDNGRNPHTGY